jgi:aspartate aminotransferase
MQHIRGQGRGFLLLTGRHAGDLDRNVAVAAGRDRHTVGFAIVEDGLNLGGNGGRGRGRRSIMREAHARSILRAGGECECSDGWKVIQLHEEGSRGQLLAAQVKAAICPFMQKFDPAALLSSRAASADEGAIIRMSAKSRELRAKGQDVVALTIGEPDFDTPEPIRSAAKQALDEGFTHYSPVAGIPELREALAEKLRVENGLNYEAANIVLANGAKQAMNNAVLSLIGPGDEAIVMSPFWLAYESSIKLAGGTTVRVAADVGENYKPPISRIAAAITPNTKLIFLNSPSNPTGAVWSRAELEELATVVRQHPRLMVLSDEIYEYILFEGEMVSFGSLPGMLERTITLNGFSKGFAMTGWRLGYAAGPLPVAQAMMRIQGTISAGANMFVQKAAFAALKGPRDEAQRMRARYQARRDMVLTGLRAIPGVKIGPIPGTFYAFPDVSAFLGKRVGNHVIDTVEQLCDWLLEVHGVTTVPGTAFGAPHSIRLSFAASEADIEKALGRVKTGLGELASASG